MGLGCWGGRETTGLRGAGLVDAIEVLARSLPKEASNASCALIRGRVRLWVKLLRGYLAFCCVPVRGRADNARCAAELAVHVQARVEPLLLASAFRTNLCQVGSESCDRWSGIILVCLAERDVYAAVAHFASSSRWRASPASLRGRRWSRPPIQQFEPPQQQIRRFERSGMVLTRNLFSRLKGLEA